jgi:hypothetical protein
MASKAGYFNNGSCFLIYQSGARLFTEMVHSYLPKWCILNYRFWCIVIYRSQLFLISEQMGDLMLTQDFKTYVFEQGFRTYFCRKADPESKGKVENVVKFVKNNFLYGRSFFDTETLQAQVLAWLQRTGNCMPHSTIRKIPLQEWAIEKEQLTHIAGNQKKTEF